MGFYNTGSEQIDYLKLNAKTSETESPFFSLQKKTDGKWGTAQSFNQISGYIMGVSRREGEYQGNPVFSVRIRFMDDSDATKLFQLEASYNNLTYSILNSLMSLDKSAPVTIRVYARPSKSDGKFYPAAYIESNGNRVDWFYAIDSLPRPAVAMVGKKKVIDDSEVIEFYHKLVDQLIEKFGSSAPKPAPVGFEALELPAPEKTPTPPRVSNSYNASIKKPSAIDDARLKFEEADATAPILDATDDDLPF
jgi:hypothetical protein